MSLNTMLAILREESDTRETIMALDVTLISRPAKGVDELRNKAQLNKYLALCDSYAMQCIDLWIAEAASRQMRTSTMMHRVRQTILNAYLDSASPYATL